MIGLAILHQDTCWIDAEGRVLTLEEMTTQHRRNVLAYLRARAKTLEFRDALAIITHPLHHHMGEHAADDLDAWLDHRTLDPEGWLEDTVLVTRLRELVAADEARLASADEGHDWWEENP